MSLIDKKYYESAFLHCLELHEEYQDRFSRNLPMQVVGMSKDDIHNFLDKSGHGVNRYIMMSPYEKSFVQSGDDPDDIQRLLLLHFASRKCEFGLALLKVLSETEFELSDELLWERNHRKIALYMGELCYQLLRELLLKEESLDNFPY